MGRQDSIFSNEFFKKKMIANNEKKIDGNFMVFKKDQSFWMSK